MSGYLAAVFLAVALPMLGTGTTGGTTSPAANGPESKQPVYISLFSTIEDHLNIEISEERLQRTLDTMRRLRQQHPGVRPTCLMLFSGTTSEALQTRDQANGLLTRVRESARAGLIEMGYDGAQEPTFLTWPRPNMRRATTGAERWLARSQAAEWFLTEYKDPVTGLPDPDRSGGVMRTAEVFGRLAYVSGVSQEIGGDSEIVHHVHRSAVDAILPGVPENTVYAARLLHGYGVSAATVGRLMSPAPTSAPELFWMDNVLRLSNTSGAPVKVVVANQGPEALQKILDGLDRSRPHVIRVQLAHSDVYLKPGFGGGRYTTPIEWAYDNPKSAHLGQDGLQSREEIDAAFKREDAVLEWLAGSFFPANPGSRFIAMADLKHAAPTRVGASVSLEILRTAANDLLTEWSRAGNYPPFTARAGDEYFSLADMFQMLATALATWHRDGAWPPSVTLQHVYGPLEMTDDLGPLGRTVAVREVAAAASGLAEALNDQAWKPVPDNVVPTWVTVGALRLNASQFLRLMVEALAAPEPGRSLTTGMNYMFSSAAEMFPKGRPRRDVGALWTLKPARLVGLE
ncbi:MAG TPA: hypothetical protein VGK32_08435 [Vicinamibacterales bacterium]|jgi:hypothetical protein